MHLVEELIVAGLLGRPGPAIPGRRFVFVDYDNESNVAVKVLGEGPTPFLALVRGVRRAAADAAAAGFGQDDDPIRSPHFGSLPDEVRNSGDRDLIGFLTWTREAREHLFSFATESGYLDGHMAEFLPCARCVFAWDAMSPLHDAAMGLYSFEPIAGSPGWRTETVLSLARRMREPGDFDALLILADALQDAGCNDERILSHCRDPLPTHDWGYCWVVDLILGRGFVSEAEPDAAPDPAA